MTSLLRVDALSVRYLGAERPALDTVDLHVDAGETLALVGESGSGKSTLAHALIGLLPRAARVESGTIRLGEQVLSGASERVWRGVRGRRIAFVPQDPTASLNPLLPIGAQVAESFLLHRSRSRDQAAADAVAALERVGIDRPDARARQLPHQLSGGMQQRVLIAMALASEPDVLIADEPTSALDVTVQKTVLDTLAELTSTAGTAVVLITHDLGVAVDRAQRIAVLHRGVIVEKGAAAQVLTTPAAPYTRDLIRAAPSLTSERLVDTGVPAADDRVVVRDLVRTFHLPGRADVRAARGVGFAVGAGRTIAIVGESGSGKTTVARMIAGAEIEDSGEIDVDDLTVTAIPRDRLRQVGERVQLVHQHPGTAMDPRWTVGRVISEALIGVLPRAERSARVRELLTDVALDPALADRTPDALSGGQRQRVAIARALAKNPRVLILDEPVSALDVVVQAQVLELLARLQRERGLTYVFVSHDLAVVRQIAHEVIVMRQGEVVERGSIAEVFDAPAHDYTRALLAAIPGSAASAPRTVSPAPDTANTSH